MTTAYLMVHIDTDTSQMTGWGIYSESPDQITRMGGCGYATLSSVTTDSYSKSRQLLIDTAKNPSFKWAFDSWGEPQ
tara:strand:- start:46378 stop:46608 length:231 start_codon:yes stop_codon:yes gene_type:complete